MINLIICDDHPLVREGLKKILTTEMTDIRIVGEANNAESLFPLVEQINLDLVLMDISMPGMNGLEAMQKIKEIKPDLPVLILTMHPADRFAVEALRSGAAGYLLKESVTTDLIKAIRKVVIEKKKYISSDVAEQLANLVQSDTDKPLYESLSDREFQVVEKIASGKKVNEIAKELSLSLRTVHTYRSRALQKLNLKSDVELTHYAMDHQIIDK